MAQTMRIDPSGWHGLRKATARATALQARITATGEYIHIDFSDGRKVRFGRDRQVSSSSLVAAAMQWARRHGAGSIELEIA